MNIYQILLICFGVILFSCEEQNTESINVKSDFFFSKKNSLQDTLKFNDTSYVNYYSVSKELVIRVLKSNNEIGYIYERKKLVWRENYDHLKSSLDAQLYNGRRVYESNCNSCHMFKPIKKLNSSGLLNKFKSEKPDFLALKNRKLVFVEKGDLHYMIFTLDTFDLMDLGLYFQKKDSLMGKNAK